MKIRSLAFYLYVCGILPLLLCGSPLPGLAAPAVTATALAITSGGNPIASGGSVASGSKIALTVTVTANGNRITTGQVNFCDTSATYCSDIYLLGTVQLTSAGTAILKFIPGIGAHTYKAVFAGTPNGATKYAASASSDVSLTVTGTNPTTTTIASSGSTGDYTLTAIVTGSGTAPDSAELTGTVSYLDTSNNNFSLATAALGAPTTALSFLNSSTLTADDLAGSVVAGDFNGDGISDLAVANYGAGTVSIFLGNGNGTFTPAANSPIAVTFDPEAIVSGDFNGDGKADLAMENSFYSGVVTVLLGNGDGTFTPAVGSPISVGGAFYAPGATAVGDFNGDGFLDLIATNTFNVGSEPGSMTVLLGKGDGTFTPTSNSPVAVGGGPDSIAVADFNGDGAPDLAIDNFDANNVTILLGNGNGTFTEATNSPISVGSFPTSVAMGDFNGDGKADLAIANSNYTTGLKGSVTVLLGNGNGTFTQAANSPITAGEDSQSVIVGDFNGDGKADLAVVNNSDDNVTILLGVGDGTFTPATNSPVRVGDFPKSAVTGDFNADGISDLAVVNSGVGTTSVLLSQLTQTATATETAISPVGTGTHQVEASYSGNSSFAPSTSSTIGLTAQQVNPSFVVSGTAVTIAAPGTTAATTSTVTVTPSGNFTGSVMLTAAVTSSPAGALDPPTVSFGSTSPVTITGANPGTAILTVTTTPATSSVLRYPTQRGAPWYAAGGASLACMLLFGFSARRKRSWPTMFVLLALLVMLTGGMLGCGAGNISNGNIGRGVNHPGTTAGTYIVTITGASGPTTSVCMVTVILQ